MSDFYGSVQLWHPAGVKVTLPVPVTAEQAQEVNYELALKFVGDALSAGWMANAPGLEQGEEKGECGWVVRSQKDGNTGMADVIDMYLVEDKFPKVRVYLNTDPERHAFEKASGLQVAKLPLYVGAGKIERGASRQTDTLVRQVLPPFGIVWKANPKYNPEETDAKKKKPARLFVRYEGQAAPKAKQGDPDTCLGRWEHFLSAEPPLAELNARLPELSKLGEEDKRLVWDAIKVHAGKNRLAWSKERRQFEVTDNMADYL